MKRLPLWPALILLLAATGCMSVKSNPTSGFYAGDPVRDARAEATAVAVEIEKGNADMDLQVRQAALQGEIEAHQVALEATRVAYTTQMSTTLIVATVEAGAQADVIRTRGQAEADRITAHTEADVRTSRVLADAGAIAIPILGVGLALALIVLAIGHSMASVRRATAEAGYVRIGVERHTLLPPPLVIHEGWLIDTRSGERARLKDAAGVNALRLAATAHSTEVALMARAQGQIAKTTGDPQPGDALMSGAATLPFVDFREQGEASEPDHTSYRQGTDRDYGNSRDLVVSASRGD